MRIATGRLGRVALGAAALLFAGVAAAQPAAPARKPNIVILLADDWGFTDVGAFGAEYATPNLDALAKEGVRFSNFHVAGSCSPTRSMLQTGVMNHRTGLANMPETIPDEHKGKPGYDTVMNHRVVTIGQMLRAAGYRTYLTGKWHLGGDQARLPHSRGYDRAFALEASGADNFEKRPIEAMYSTADWTENGKPADLPKDYYSSRFVVEKAIDYIERDRASGKPFLASINFLANHIPVQAPDADIARYAGQYHEGWTKLREARARRAAALGVMPANTRLVTMPTTRDWATLDAEEKLAAMRVMQVYAAMATAMDREVGRLVAHLKKTGDYENTIFIFTSDNGAEPTDPYNRQLNRALLGLRYDTSTANIGRRNSFSAIGPSWASAAASPLSGYKFSATEGGLRVPLIVAWPGQVQGGRIASALTHVTDLVPTIAELTGTPMHGGQWEGRAVEPVTGRSLAPLLRGEATSVRGDDAPLGYELSGNAALFRGDHKLVRNLPPTGDGKWRLFDIVRDPGETHDLSAEMPERFAALMADYRAYARANGVLEMPAGYTADKQINKFSMRQQGAKQIGIMAAWAVGVILLFALPFWWMRRRRRRARGIN
ncbi:arylsulfatase [Sphingoaurantiacus capsulatus]|uniref:Arylsulfatase n=1 Tax=Sphingoaurantiacus capsulatus TaxID=1771310 RepID=A0ABV7X504_9SPHN